MNDESNDYDKKFYEIIKSEDLKNISESFKKEKVFTTKDLLLIQQSITDTLSYLSDIIFSSIVDGPDDVAALPSYGNYQPMLSLMYKISIDFNEEIEDMLECNMYEILEEDDDNEE